MHLKPYHKLSKKDPSLELNQTTREHANHRTIAKEEKCTSTSTKQGLLCAPISATFHKQSDTIWQASYVAGGKVSLNSIDVKLSGPPITIHHGDEGEGTLDIHAIIKPGNTKEKIAFFASHQCSNSRTGTMKVRSTWNINGRAAKRRKTGELKAKNPVEKMKGANTKSHQFEPFACGIDHCSVHFVEGANAMFSDGSLSVIEMVAFLEQRARVLLSDNTRKCTNSCTVTRFTVQSKGVVSVTEHLTAVTPCQIPFEKGTFDSAEQEIETICVLDMVAKLESECLKHQSDRSAGSLSRNNSFRRHVGRLLLASGARSSSSNSEASLSDTRDSSVQLGSFMHNDCSGSSSESSLADNDALTVPCKFSELPEVKNFYMSSSVVAKATPVKSTSCNIELNPDSFKNSLPSCSKAGDFQCEAGSTSQDFLTDGETNLPQTSNKLEEFPVTEKLNTQEKAYTFSFGEEPLPGTLFFQHCDHHSTKDHVEVNGTSKINLQIMNQVTPASEEAYKSKRALITLDRLSISYVEGVTPAVDSLKDPVVHDFWKIRYKIQQLLEPQQYIVFLPHHIVVNIFRFLPTKTLAALKCTCHYFKFIIEYYDIRPVDSLWVCDLRYKDDPCKQCKKQYVKGDVSLCWWHPKPYCQSLPYGPGYWMCCHRSHKDSAGCKVGLHDNRWVPACHSFNRQMYKKRKELEREDW